MKHLIYIIVILFSIQTNGQDSTEEKKFRIDLFTHEKTSNDTIRSSIIEIYSGSKRIETAISDFDGISIFFLKSNNIIDSKIRLKVYGPKCEIFEKEYTITSDLNTKINLDYGETKYTHPNQLHKMLKELDIKLKFSEMQCGFEEPTVIIKN